MIIPSWAITIPFLKYDSFTNATPQTLGSLFNNFTTLAVFGNTLVLALDGDLFTKEEYVIMDEIKC